MMPQRWPRTWRIDIGVSDSSGEGSLGVLRLQLRRLRLEINKTDHFAAWHLGFMGASIPSPWTSNPVGDGAVPSATHMLCQSMN